MVNQEIQLPKHGGDVVSKRKAEVERRIEERRTQGKGTKENQETKDDDVERINPITGKPSRFLNKYTYGAPSKPEPIVKAQSPPTFEMPFQNASLEDLAKSLEKAKPQKISLNYIEYWNKMALKKEMEEQAAKKLAEEAKKSAEESGPEVVDTTYKGAGPLIAAFEGGKALRQPRLAEIPRKPAAPARTENDLSTKDLLTELEEDRVKNHTVVQEMKQQTSDDSKNETSKQNGPLKSPETVAPKPMILGTSFGSKPAVGRRDASVDNLTKIKPAESLTKAKSTLSIQTVTSPPTPKFEPSLPVPPPIVLPKKRLEVSVRTQKVLAKPSSNYSAEMRLRGSNDLHKTFHISVPRRIQTNNVVNKKTAASEDKKLSTQAGSVQEEPNKAALGKQKTAAQQQSKSGDTADAAEGKPGSGGLDSIIASAKGFFRNFAGIYDASAEPSGKQSVASSCQAESGATRGRSVRKKSQSHARRSASSKPVAPKLEDSVLEDKKSSKTEDRAKAPINLDLVKANKTATTGGFSVASVPVTIHTGTKEKVVIPDKLEKQVIVVPQEPARVVQQKQPVAAPVKQPATSPVSPLKESKKINIVVERKKEASPRRVSVSVTSDVSSADEAGSDLGRAGGPRRPPATMMIVSNSIPEEKPKDPNRPKMVFDAFSRSRQPPNLFKSASENILPKSRQEFVYPYKHKPVPVNEKQPVPPPKPMVAAYTFGVQKPTRNAPEVKVNINKVDEDFLSLLTLGEAIETEHSQKRHMQMGWPQPQPQPSQQPQQQAVLQVPVMSQPVSCPKPASAKQWWQQQQQQQQQQLQQPQRQQPPTEPAALYKVRSMTLSKPAPQRAVISSMTDLTAANVPISASYPPPESGTWAPPWRQHQRSVYGSSKSLHPQPYMSSQESLHSVHQEPVFAKTMAQRSRITPEIRSISRSSQSVVIDPSAGPSPLTPSYKHEEWHEAPRLGQGRPRPAKVKEAIQQLDAVYETLQKECDQIEGKRYEQKPKPTVPPRYQENYYSGQPYQQSQPAEFINYPPTPKRYDSIERFGRQSAEQKAMTPLSGLPTNTFTQPPAWARSEPKQIGTTNQKMDFTRKWLEGDLKSFAEDTKPDLLKFGPEPDFDQRSVGSGSAEVAMIINKNRRPRYTPDLLPPKQHKVVLPDSPPKQTKHLHPQKSFVVAPYPQSVCSVDTAKKRFSRLTDQEIEPASFEKVTSMENVAGVKANYLPAEKPELGWVQMHVDTFQRRNSDQSEPSETSGSRAPSRRASITHHMNTFIQQFENGDGTSQPTNRVYADDDAKKILSANCVTRRLQGLTPSSSQTFGPGGVSEQAPSVHVFAAPVGPFALAPSLSTSAHPSQYATTVNSFHTAFGSNKSNENLQLRDIKGSNSTLTEADGYRGYRQNKQEHFRQKPKLNLNPLDDVNNMVAELELNTLEQEPAKQRFPTEATDHFGVDIVAIDNYSHGTAGGYIPEKPESYDNQYPQQAVVHEPRRASVATSSKRSVMTTASSNTNAPACGGPKTTSEARNLIGNVLKKTPSTATASSVASWQRPSKVGSLKNIFEAGVPPVSVNLALTGYPPSEAVSSIQQSKSHSAISSGSKSTVINQVEKVLADLDKFQTQKQSTIIPRHVPPPQATTEDSTSLSASKNSLGRRKDSLKPPTNGQELGGALRSDSFTMFQVRAPDRQPLTNADLDPPSSMYNEKTGDMWRLAVDDDDYDNLPAGPRPLRKRNTLDAITIDAVQPLSPSVHRSASISDNTQKTEPTSPFRAVFNKLRPKGSATDVSRSKHSIGSLEFGRLNPDTTGGYGVHKTQSQDARLQRSLDSTVLSDLLSENSRSSISEYPKGPQFDARGLAQKKKFKLPSWAKKK